MNRPATNLTLGATAVVVLGALAFFENSAAIQRLPLQDPNVHVVLIALANLIMLALAALSLRSFHTHGSARSLVLAAGILGFVAVYLWHGVFTTTAPAFAFLIYGPASRAVFGLALPFLIVERVVAKRRRFLVMIVVLALALGLAALAWGLHPTIATWALGSTMAQLQTTRLVIEAIAGGLALFAVGLVLLQGERQPAGPNLAVAVALLLLGLESIYFLFTGAWTLTWWAAHGIAAASSLVLTVAVVGELNHTERANEVNHLLQLNAMRTRFINAAAHELGTPLTPIHLQLSLLRTQKDPLTEQQSRSLDTIQRNVDRLTDLTRSILEGAKAQEGQFPIRLEVTDLRETMDDLERSYKPWCTEKDLELSLHAPANLEMFSDRRRIHQIVSNFVSNAIKNTPAGGKVRIVAGVKKGRIRVQVHDTGRGMTEHERKRLFQAFTQLEDPSKVIGSGLGLYISRQLAERLGGFVGVTSQGLGRGSTFFVDLPVQAPAMTIEDDDAPAEQVAGAPRATML